MSKENDQKLMQKIRKTSVVSRKNYQTDYLDLIQFALYDSVFSEKLLRYRIIQEQKPITKVRSKNLWTKF